jgi:hypothetical protein
MKKFTLLLSLIVIFCFALTAIAQNVNVTATNSGNNAGYPTLKDAFDAVNAGTHTGSITMTVTANTTEAASCVLNASGTGFASYGSIAIAPSTGQKTITGNIAGILVDLNGADFVTLANGLLLDNQSTAATASTIRFIADANNNTLQNITILGAGTSVTSGTVFFSTGTTSGNDGNLIASCNIGASTAGYPANGVYSSGTSASIDNSGNTITQCNISDYFSATLVTCGINLSATGNSVWTITSNKLFQSQTRMYTTANTHNGIFIGAGAGYTVSSNTIGYANSSAAGLTNMIGNSSLTITGTFPTAYTITGSANATRYIAINCTFTAGGTVSNIQGNTVGGIALLTSSGATTTNGVLCGINVLSGNANIGTTAANVIGGTTGQSSLYAASTTAGAVTVGIYANTSNIISILNNTIGSIDAVGTAATLAGAFTGIDCTGSPGLFNISGNNIGNNTADNIRTGYTLSGANLSNTGTLTSTTGTSAIVGIRNSSTGASLNIQSNQLRGIATSGTTTTVTGITNTGAITTTETISNNSIGTSSLDCIRYAVANSGALAGISNSNGASTTALLIQTNDIRGITHSVAGSSAHIYIKNTSATLSQNISSNTFTNLTVNTTGSVTFISNDVALSATGTCTVSSNSIVTAFNKSGAGGTVTLYLTTGGPSSAVGSTKTEQNNNFSNITLTGATIINGWLDIEGATGGGPVKTITNNTFNNWTCGSSSVLVMQTGFSYNGTSLSNNNINNITGQGAITGISIGSTNGGASQNYNSNTITSLISNGTGGPVIGITGGSLSITTNNIASNTINTLSTTSAITSLIAIQVSAGSTVNIYKNKIYDLLVSGAATINAVNGLVLAGGTTVNAYNNFIGDLRATAANFTDAIRGISVTSTAVTSTYNVFYNTVYINATSSSSTFGTTGIYHLVSATSTTAALDLRDNLIVNTSTPGSGSGLTVAYRISGTALNNYAATSNNNDFYAGTIFNDGTNSDFSIAAYKSRVSTKDAASISVNAPFLSTVGSNSNFLKINPATQTQLESGGIRITTPIAITDDYENDIRWGETGYSGTGTAPDIGADEFNGTPAANMSYSSANTVQVTGNTAIGISNVAVIRIDVTTTGSLNPLSLTQLTLNANGTTNIADLTGAKVYYTGGSSSFNTGSQFGTTPPTIANFTVSGTQLLAEGTNYFWLAYDISNSAAGGDVIDGECINMTVAGNTQVPATTAPAGTRTILSRISAGNYTIGSTMFRAISSLDVKFEERTRKTERQVVVSDKSSSVTASSNTDRNRDMSSDNSRIETETITEKYMVPVIDGKEYKGTLIHYLSSEEQKQFNTDALAVYPTITAAVNDLNLRGITGAVNFILTDASFSINESFPLTINQVTGSSLSNTITFKPSSGNTVSISGNAAAIFKLNGADFVTIDGSNNGTSSRDMSLLNTNAGTSTAVIWIGSTSASDGALNNTIKNCIIDGSGSYQTSVAVLTGSGITYGSAAESPNSNTTITNNLIRSSQNAVYSFGNATISDNNMNISLNTFGSSTVAQKLGFRGILIQNDSNSTVTQNTILGIVSSTTSSSTMAGIYIGGNQTNVTVSRNSISDVKQTNTAGWGAVGIYAIGTSTSAVNILNNIIWDVTGVGYLSGLTATDNGYGIYVNSGTGYNIYYNTVSLTTNQTTGIPGCLNVAATYTTVNSLKIKNNIFLNNQTVGTYCYAVVIQSANTVFNDLNYNDYFALDPTNGRIGRFGATVINDMPTWRTNTAKDVSSISSNPGLTSATVLAPNPTNPNSWNVNGTADPTTAVGFDFLGNGRSTDYQGGPTDMGAFEFNPWQQSAAPDAVMTGTIADNGTTTYKVGDRIMGTITWHGATLPGASSFKYYSGQPIPNSNPNGQHVALGHYLITVTGGSGYTYDISLKYDAAMLGLCQPSIGSLKIFKTNDFANVLIYNGTAGNPNTTDAAGMVTVNGANGFSYFGITDPVAPLPVELASFNSSVSGRDVMLKWSTASEQNNKGFDIERKTVSSSSNEWKKMGTVEGHNNSNTTQNYQYKDARVDAGKYNYRLKQCDYNGNFAYYALSNEVDISIPKQFSLSQNYPNPFNPVTKIDFELPVDGKVTMKLFDITGREAASIINNEIMTAGYYTYNFSGVDLSSGTYIYRLSVAGSGNNQNFVMTKKMTLVK